MHVESQYSLSKELENPFVFYRLNPDQVTSPPDNLVAELRNEFEKGNVLVVEGLQPESLEFFLDMPSVEFPEWVPPVEDEQIFQTPIDSEHPFWAFYPDKHTIEAFQFHIRKFQNSLEDFHQRLFRDYKFKHTYWSWRFNKMDLGYLHLDIPPEYPEHQMRTFINLSRRPRIIEVGPTIQELFGRFLSEEDLGSLKSKSNFDFLTEIKQRYFKEKGFEDFILPRHTLRLAPGAIWISHSSLICHGVVFGEKTACMEHRLERSELSSEQHYFHKIMDDIRLSL